MITRVFSHLTNIVSQSHTPNSGVCNRDSDNEGEGTMSAPVAVPLDILQGTVDTGAGQTLYHLNLLPYRVWLEGFIFHSAVIPSMGSTRQGRFMRPQAAKLPDDICLMTHY